MRKVGYFRPISDVVLLYLCFLKYESNYSDEELFPGVDSEIPDKMLRNLKANRKRASGGKYYSMLFQSYLITTFKHFFVRLLHHGIPCAIHP